MRAWMRAAASAIRCSSSSIGSSFAYPMVPARAAAGAVLRSRWTLSVSLAPPPSLGDFGSMMDWNFAIHFFCCNSPFLARRREARPQRAPSRAPLELWGLLGVIGEAGKGLMASSSCSRRRRARITLTFFQRR